MAPVVEEAFPIEARISKDTMDPTATTEGHSDDGQEVMAGTTISTTRISYNVQPIFLCRIICEVS